MFGRTLGQLTILMALLLLGSIGAGIWLAFSGNAGLVAFGLLLIGVGIVAAWMMDKLLVWLEDLALAWHIRWGRIAGGTLAILCGALPTLLVMVWAYDCLQWFNPGERFPNSVAEWLFSYAVATVPWTLFALWSGQDRRTLNGVRAYAVHIAYWLLSASFLLAPDQPGLATALMLVPAILPLTLGTVMACADRAMLATVRI